MLKEFGQSRNELVERFRRAHLPSRRLSLIDEKVMLWSPLTVASVRVGLIRARRFRTRASIRRVMLPPVRRWCQLGANPNVGQGRPRRKMRGRVSARPLPESQICRGAKLSAGSVRDPVEGAPLDVRLMTGAGGVWLDETGSRTWLVRDRRRGAWLTPPKRPCGRLCE